MLFKTKQSSDLLRCVGMLDKANQFYFLNYRLVANQIIFAGIKSVLCSTRFEVVHPICKSFIECCRDRGNRLMYSV